MSQNSYIPPGPLADNTFYIERQADRELLRHIQAMEYVLITAPHQQGMTSLVKHLMSNPKLLHTSCIYVDVSTLGTQSEAKWYKSLCSRITKVIKEKWPNFRSAVPQNSVEWQDYLFDAAGHAQKVGQKFVIILDEIGAVHFDGLTSFFMTLRDFYISRQVQEDSKFGNLTFVLVGTFNPQDFITEQGTSPFINIVNPVSLSDFTLDQVKELMSRKGFDREQLCPLAERIHYWTDGQPYQTQFLCNQIDFQSSPEEVDAAVHRLRREDTNNLPHVIKEIDANNHLVEYLQSILANEIIAYRPSEDLWQNRLFLLGLIKPNKSGNCSIRNRIYQQVILDHQQSMKPGSRSDESRSTGPKDLVSESPVIRVSENRADVGLSTLENGVDFVFVTALPEERDAVLAKIPGVSQLPPTNLDVRTYFSANLPATFSDSSTCTYRVIIMPLLAMGRVQAALATADAIKRWHPRYILLVGIAGGLAAQSVSLGDILISTQIVDYELQKITPKGPQIRWEAHQSDPQLLGACQAFRDYRWHGPLSAQRPVPGKPKRLFGPIVSGDKIIAFEKVLANYREMWPKLIGVEMEASGVATAAFQSSERPGFFMVRCVSDLADENKGTPRVEQWRTYACDAAASFAVALLKSGPVPKKKL